MIKQITSWFLNQNQRNAEISFFPSSSWGLLQANVVPTGTSPDMFPLSGPTFSYIQAFFDTNDLTVDPTLCVWSGKVTSNGTPIINPIRFAYSGQMIQIKGCAILDAGTDIMGNTYESTVIGVTPTTMLSEVYAFGGAY